MSHKANDDMLSTSGTQAAVGEAAALRREPGPRAGAAALVAEPRARARRPRRG